MGPTEVREPIPHGFLKLVGFIAIVAWAAFLAWRSLHPVVAAVAFLGIFASVRLFHSEGWTHWLREYWFWNVRGVDECFHKNNKDGELKREIVPHVDQEVYEPYGRQDYCANGSWHIVIRRSGWSFLNGQVLLGRIGLDLYWSVRQYKTKNCVREVGGLFSDQTMTVMLKQNDGTCVEFTIEDALQAVEDLTILSPCSQVPWCYEIKGTRSFGHILQMKPPASSSAATPSVA